MAPRTRDPKNRGLPPNLYERNGYYSYRNPLDGREYGIGKDKHAAIEEAIEANFHLAGKLPQPRLKDRLTGESERTVAAWLNRYEAILAKRETAASTRRMRKLQMKLTREHLGERVICRVDTLAVADMLKTWTDQGKNKMAQGLRAFLIDVFRSAEAAGWIDRGTNPAEITDAPKVKVRRARLTLEAFNVIYDAAKALEPWVMRSMELAIVSAQRREDVVAAQFAEVHDRKLWVEQMKTGSRVCIPLDLRVAAVDLSLEEVIRRCRDNVVSRFLVHHRKQGNKAKRGDPLHPDTITKGFMAARERTSLKWEPKVDKAGKELPVTSPTFHEIRSLAARLYTDQYGKDFAQALLGHKHAITTDLYRDVRGAEWIEIKAG